MASEDQATGTVETKAEFLTSPLEFTRHWLQAIELAGEDEKTWREDAKDTLERYHKTKAASFNVLYANTQTILPALYNSEPVPDCRRRFNDSDPVGKTASDMLERLLSIQAELYGFDATMKAAVKDRQLAGRGVTRVRVVKGHQGSVSVQCEPVIWDDYRRGPAKTRKDQPWEAFRHKMTREELVALNPEVGPKVNLNAVVSGADPKKHGDLPDMFKRAEVWEVWDRTERKVYWFAESFPDGPLLVQDDPYRLREFWCTPDPLYAVALTDSLIPVCEFKIWKPLADEMDDLTARISGIVKVMKLRGLYAGQFESIITKLEGLNDGEMAAATDSARAMTEGGLDKAIWMWPVDLAIQTVNGLYEAREQAKMALYEMTGVADILRGSTEASETATAQQIKAQWGSLRLQDGQRDVQRYARDLFRMKGDLSCQEMDFAAICAVTGISFQPPEGAPPEQAQQILQTGQAVASLLKGPDLAREFAIEIETDSTIRADLSRAQQNISGFVTGLSEFMQGVGPAVQAGFMPPEIAVEYIGAFSRNFKLGREAEALTEKWVKFLEEKAKEPPKPSAEEQKAQLEMQQMQAEAQAKAADRQAELQATQQKNAMEMEREQMKLQIEREKLQLQREKMALDAQAAQQQHDLSMRSQQEEHAFKQQAMREDAAFAQESRMKDAEFEDERRASELTFMKQRQAAKPNGETRA